MNIRSVSSAQVSIQRQSYPVFLSKMQNDHKCTEWLKNGLHAIVAACKRVWVAFCAWIGCAKEAKMVASQNNLKIDLQKEVPPSPKIQISQKITFTPKPSSKAKETKRVTRQNNSALALQKEVPAPQKITFNPQPKGKEQQPAAEKINPERLVVDGYGELVLRVKEGDNLRPVTKEEYEKAYRIFQRHSPVLHEAPKKALKSRIVLMREELSGVHPGLVGTFIPRTLHDLVFIRKSIEEDVEKLKHAKAEGRQITFTPAKNSWCVGDPNAGPKMGPEGYPILPVAIQISTPEDVEQNFSDLMKIGHRLNTAFCEVLDKKAPNAEHLKLGQIQEIVDEHIQFMVDFHKHPDAGRFATLQEGRISISGNFGEASSSRGGIFPMAVSNERHAQVIRNASALECRESSIGKVLAYRGGVLETDSPIKDGKGYCMSFGSGLFPGVVSDSGACAYHYIRQRDGYAFVLDPEKESSNVFLVPSHTALESLYGVGEAWHYRFKVSQEEKEMIGVWSSIGLVPGPNRDDRFKSTLSREQLIAKFEDLKRRNFVLMS